MSKFSFDVVSDFDKAEMNNAFDQAKREIENRYDLKGTKATIEWLDSDKSGLKITGDNDFQIDAILDILRKKLATRGLSQKVLDASKEASVGNLMTTKLVTFRKGLSQENAKKITKLLKEHYPKSNTQIMGEEIRVSSAKKDELQAIIQLLQETDFDFPLIFTNYR
jgi:cyclic-di-GMP-binding protein